MKYEITFIVPEETTEEPVLKILGSVGTKVLDTKEIGVKSFTYPIAKHNIGRYFCLKFEIETGLLAKLEKSLKAEKSILRYLLVRELRVRAPRPPKPEKKTVRSKQQVVSIQAEEKGKKEEAVEAPVKVKEAVEKVQKPVEQKLVPRAEPAPAESVVQELAEKEVGIEKVAVEKAPESEEKPALVEKPVKVEKKEAPVAKKSKEPEIEIDKLDEKLKDLVGDE